MNCEVKCDRLIIGAGLYGLYSALYCGKKGLNVIVLEADPAPFMRATYVNQARVHMGYHYPRSLTTALKSAGYFQRFVNDFDFCIFKKFNQIYATSEKFSWTGAHQFMDFCKAAQIRCDEVAVSKYFNDGMCDGAFLTDEYTYDAQVLKNYFLDAISKLPNVEVKYNVEIFNIFRETDKYVVEASEGETYNLYSSSYIINATYASVNQILKHIFADQLFKIKYELCEIIICKPSENLKDIGITVMDGPFFSVMPFGLTGLHSLTAVTFTPHVTCYEERPSFMCQENLKDGQFKCNAERLNNCNLCPNKPKTAWSYMSHLAFKYLKSEYQLYYNKSLYSMKPILKCSEVDDSRPTSIIVHSGGKNKSEPTFISVLSGKINTVYDLDEFL